MSNEEQDTRASGSVPNAFGNALAWKWTRDMPPAVRRTGLPTLLYALRAMATASGELRFTGDRKPIRIQDIAKAACCDEKDARRYLEAAQRAGVVAVVGGRQRGRAALYAIVMQPWPDWKAAAEHLEATKRERPDRRKVLWTEPEVRGAPPELSEEKFGGQPRNFEGDTETEVRGAAPVEVRGAPPVEFGGQPPNNPGVTQEASQDGAEVSFQPQVDGPSGEQIDSQDNNPRADPPLATALSRCSDCHIPLIRPAADGLCYGCRQAHSA